MELDLVAARLLGHGVQRLMDVADQMHGELERLDLPVATGAAQLLLYAAESGDDAVAFFGVRLAVARRVVGLNVERDVDEMPSGRRGVGVAVVVGPARDRGERTALEQPVHQLRGRLRQPLLGDLGDDRVPFLAPRQRLSGAGECEQASERGGERHGQRDRSHSVTSNHGCITGGSVAAKHDNRKMQPGRRPSGGQRETT